MRPWPGSYDALTTDVGYQPPGGLYLERLFDQQPPPGAHGAGPGLRHRDADLRCFALAWAMR